ncbi:helix-turn-helix domain-containing protein [Kitasatospora sp. NPDC057223]|uniref:helix-turn-helix domain-containing protein n=1 Tax=Kitasatospora sp. NPDC057223 TaxID=3346055 RepID=UPI0036299DCC
MNESSPRSEEQAAVRPVSGDIAQRVALRSRELGLTREEVAGRAGMAPRYLQSLEELAGDFDPASALRLAAVLKMTYSELVEGRADLPPGQQSAAPHPRLGSLTPDECWDRLSDHGVGRVALSAESGPAVLPVNYLVDARSLVYRTARRGIAAVAEGSEVAFEVDQVNELLSDGWSVLVVGSAEHITDIDTVRRLADQPGAVPWAPGPRDLWVRVVPSRVTGRSISTA